MNSFGFFELVGIFFFQESVLDQTTTIEQDEDENEDIYEPLRQVDCQRLEAEKQKFNAAIDTLDSALLRLEQLWISNVRRLYFLRLLLSIFSAM
jgi:hypothetical protein